MILTSLRPALYHLQDRIAGRLGCSLDRRGPIIASMLQRGAVEVTGYWTQLLIAAGMATFGLVLDSTAGARTWAFHECPSVLRGVEWAIRE